MIKPRDYQTKAIQEVFDALKKNDQPVLLYSSVGSGKSLICAFLCKRFEYQNKRVLCLVNSSELVRNNSEAFKVIGGSPSVFCASLSDKSYNKNIIFATPQSVIVAIKKNHPIANIIFNLIIVDEADNIAFKKPSSIFMRILRHYRQEYAPMRLLGMTGTPFRLDNGKSESISGAHGLFKSVVGNITTEWLIDNNYLVKPSFGLKHVDSIDMTSYHVEKSAKNKHEALNKIVDKNHRLTWEILQEVQKLMKDRNGAFIFCSSISHCFEAMTALPEGSAKMIVGSTKDKERNEILTLARNKEIKYLVSVSCLLVGIDVPFFDTSVFLRPTQSLRIFLQAIGRSLRLHPDKKDSLILDYAKNLETFDNLDHPMINEAIQPKESDDEKDYPIPCYTCNTGNSLFQRRCRGFIDGKRCEHFFEWHDCKNCGGKNDRCARECRLCHAELIDPNDRLSRITQDKHLLDVIEANYLIKKHLKTNTPIIHARYKCKQAMVFENYFTHTEKCKNIAYGRFIKQHCIKPSDWYKHIDNTDSMNQMINDETLKTPYQLNCTRDEYGHYRVSSKAFYTNE